jgi:lipid A 3-O-deacylase
MKRFPVAAAALAAIALAAASPAPAAESGRLPGSRGTYGLYVENDLAAGTDRHYTNGEKLFWISPEIGRGEARCPAPRWIDSLSRILPGAGRRGVHRFYSVALSQSIYTPEDITRRVPDSSDRPYAGYLYAGLAVYALDDDRLDSAEIDVGIVGPSSLAGAAQRIWHHTFGWDRPRGWDYQLKDEAALGLFYSHSRKILKPRMAGGFDRDLLFHAGASLSNVYTGASAGLEFRFGWGLPRDFGSAPLQPGRDGGALPAERWAGRPGKKGPAVHFFLSLEGRAVARDIFLDGNTLRDSARVDKRPFVAAAAAGLALRAKGWQARFGYVFLSREFRTQHGTHTYASLRLTITP